MKISTIRLDSVIPKSAEQLCCLPDVVWLIVSVEDVHAGASKNTHALGHDLLPLAGTIFECKLPKDLTRLHPRVASNNDAFWHKWTRLLRSTKDAPVYRRKVKKETIAVPLTRTSSGIVQKVVINLEYLTAINFQLAIHPSGFDDLVVSIERGIAAGDLGPLSLRVCFCR